MPFANIVVMGHPRAIRLAMSLTTVFPLDTE